jgi:hypothetical protein
VWFPVKCPLTTQWVSRFDFRRRQKINTQHIAEESWSSPKGKCLGAIREKKKSLT